VERISTQPIPSQSVCIDSFKSGRTLVSAIQDVRENFTYCAIHHADPDGTCSGYVEYSSMLTGLLGRPYVLRRTCNSP
jgi:hypothetical protein